MSGGPCHIVHSLSLAVFNSTSDADHAVQSVIVALVVSWLDYCNAVLLALPVRHIERLQSVQNAVARLVFRIRRSQHIADNVLISLHWLLVPSSTTHRLGIYSRVSIVSLTYVPSRQRPLSSASHRMAVPPAHLYAVIIIIMFVYYSCSQNATTEPTSVTQDSTDTIERKASIYNQT